MARAPCMRLDRQAIASSDVIHPGHACDQSLQAPMADGEVTLCHRHYRSPRQPLHAHQSYSEAPKVKNLSRRRCSNRLRPAVIGRVGIVTCSLHLRPIMFVLNSVKFTPRQFISLLSASYGQGRKYHGSCAGYTLHLFLSYCCGNLYHQCCDMLEGWF